LKLNHLLFDELFKWKKTCIGLGGRRTHAIMRCCWKGNVLLSIPVKASRRK
jgi:hypothetical protein